MIIKFALFTIALAALLSVSKVARADSSYAIAGTADFTSGGITEQINYSFDLTYTTGGPFTISPVVSDMQLSSLGPFAITTWDDMVASSEYVGFFDAAGDEFDLEVAAFYPTSPVINGAYVWGCGSSECEKLFSGGSNRTDMLYYAGTVDPEVTPIPTPEPSTLALLALGIGLMGLTRLKVCRQA